MAFPSERLAKWREVIAVVQRAYEERVGGPFDVFRPRRFTEKMQWRKLFDRNPRHGVFCDKLAARSYIADGVGADCLPDLLWHGSDPHLLPLDTLEPPYIIKCTHGSGFNITVRDREAIDASAIRARLAEWLAVDYGARTLQPAYRRGSRRIIVERLLLCRGGYPPEVKFFVFDGVARLVMHRINFGDQKGERTQRFYDADWRPIPIRIAGVPYGADTSPPAQLTVMRGMAERIGRGIDHVRVDFLIGDDRFVVGELTSYHRNGFIAFEDDAHDRMMGDWWRLPLPLPRAIWAMLLHAPPPANDFRRAMRERARRARQRERRRKSAEGGTARRRREPVA